MAMQGKVELPHQIPNVVQPGVHPLPPKWTVNVRRIAGDEDAPGAQLCYLAVMDPKIAAPVQPAGFYASGCAFSQYLPHKIKRRSISFCFIDNRHYTPASG